MKAFTQWVLPLAIVAIVVGGANYIRHWSVQKPTRKAQPLTPTETEDINKSPPLIFPVTRAQADPDDTNYNAEYEHPGDHHFDFWFTNPEAREVRIALSGKSCTCTDVKLGTLTAEQSRDWALLSAGDSIAPLLGAGPSFLSAVALARLAPQFEWTPLEAGQKVFGTIPARSGDDPLLGIVRFGFNTKEEGPKLLTGRIMVYPDGVRWHGETQLELPVSIVAPLKAEKQLVELDDITPGSRKSDKFIVWSSTRPTINLSLTPVQVDTNATYESPQPLSELELKALQERLTTAGNPTRVRSAVAVPFAVVESQGDRQLDLGPLALRWKAELADDKSVSLMLAARAMVRGEVRVVGGTDRNQIDLKAFSSRIGVNTAVLLSSLRDGLKLSLAGIEPAESRDLITARLEDATQVGGRPQWKLWVSVPPNKAAGQIPAETAVILAIEGSQRQVRIPVLGRAEGK